MDRNLAYLLRPGGEIDTQVRKPVTEGTSGTVILEGAGVRAMTTVTSWLILVTKAYRAGWSSGPSAQTINAEDARQLAAVLAKADLGQKCQPLVTAVQKVAMAGEFRVVVTADRMRNPSV
jgi:hypothetical protein